MAALKFSHHFVPHHHKDTDEHHRAHALNPAALFGYLLIFTFTVTSLYFVRVNAPQILGQVTYTAEQIIQLTNIKRAEHGLDPLVINALLANAAQAKAVDMFSNNYWAHYSPQGKSPWSFISAIGYKYIYAGENLARDFNDSQSVVNAWMASPTHRSNLLDENFKEIGVAVADGNLSGREGALVVQMFGSSVTQLAEVPVDIGETVSGEQTEVESAEPVPITAVAQLGDETYENDTSATTSTSSGSATVLASNAFSLSRIISFALVGLIFSLFVVEVAFASKKSHIHIKSSTLAHLGLLGLVLFTVWWAAAGVVI